MSNEKQNFLGDLNTPSYGGSVVVTPSDTTVLLKPSKGLYIGGIVGTSYNVSVLMLDGSTAALTGVAAGTILPFRVRRVNLTGTSAPLVIALY